jgi:hypothetical protein
MKYGLYKTESYNAQWEIINARPAKPPAVFCDEISAPSSLPIEKRDLGLEHIHPALPPGLRKSQCPHGLTAGRD